MTEPNQPGDDAENPVEDLVEEELLIEDVSIDGMCGVY
jgi:mycofactocin precursor